VADKGLVRFRKVTLGLNDGKQTAVLSGLKAGALVILNPGSITPGMKISPKLQPLSVTKSSSGGLEGHPES